jgi:cell division protein FtsB
MTHRSRQILCVLLLLEVVGFSYTYFWGTQGIQVLWQAQAENKVAEEKNRVAEMQVAELVREVALWKTQPFYREKVAREQLQMCRKGDTVYYIS